jgi:hypothetical protein
VVKVDSSPLCFAAGTVIPWVLLTATTLPAFARILKARVENLKVLRIGGFGFQKASVVPLVRTKTAIRMTDNTASESADGLDAEEQLVEDFKQLTAGIATIENWEGITEESKAAASDSETDSQITLPSYRSMEFAEDSEETLAFNNNQSFGVNTLVTMRARFVAMVINAESGSPGSTKEGYAAARKLMIHHTIDRIQPVLAFFSEIPQNDYHKALLQHKLYHERVPRTCAMKNYRMISSLKRGADIMYDSRYIDASNCTEKLLVFLKNRGSNVDDISKHSMVAHCTLKKQNFIDNDLDNSVPISFIAAAVHGVTPRNQYESQKNLEARIKPVLDFVESYADSLNLPVLVGGDFNHYLCNTDLIGDWTVSIADDLNMGNPDNHTNLDYLITKARDHRARISFGSEIHFKQDATYTLPPQLVAEIQNQLADKKDFEEKFRYIVDHAPLQYSVEIHSE